MIMNIKNRFNRFAALVLALILTMGGIGFANSTTTYAAIPASAPEIELPPMSEFTNISPERLYQDSDNNITVKSFVNPVGFSCSVHILSTDKGNIVVDPGYFDEEMKEYIESIGDIDAIVLTHCHWDHLKGLNELKENYPNAKIYINQLDVNGLYDATLNFSEGNAGTEAFVIEAEANVLIEGKHNIAGYEMDLIHSPGHSPGSSLFYFGNENLLFVGDTLGFGGITRYDLPNSNIADLYMSMDRLKNLDVHDNTEVFFGHGEHISFKNMLTTFPCFINPLKLSIKKEDGTVIPIQNLYFDNKTIMFPARLISETVAGTKVEWDSSTKTATINLPQGKIIEAKIGTENIIVDGIAFKTDATTTLQQERTYVSGAFIAEELRDNLEWILEPAIHENQN